MLQRRQYLAWLAGTGCLPAAARSQRPANAAALSRLGQLAPNQAATLGPVDVVGPFNDTARKFGLHRTGPRARDFCRRMVWAPERGCGLYAGANHGSPHRLNDVWEFDLAALSWVLLYAPDLPRGYGDLGPDASDVIFADGELRTRRGGPAVIAHTWSGLSWDPGHRCMLFMNTWPVDVDAMVRSIGADPAGRDRSPPLWAFDPAARTWSRWRTPEPWPKAAVGALLEYVPELRGHLWHLNNWQLEASWLLGDEPRNWARICDAKLQPDFRSQAPGRELVGYHDPQRRLVVAQFGERTHHFNTTTRRWLDRTQAQAPRGHDATGTFVLDPVSGDGLLVDLNQGQLWRHNPDSAGWTRLSPKGPPMPAGPRTLAYADAHLKVLVVIDDVTAWVYRPPPRAAA